MTKKYDLMLEGKVITVNNFKFDDGKLDHAWNTGRLCVVIYTDDEFEYVLPITHAINPKFKHQYVYINEESFEEINKNRHVQSTLNHRTRASVSKKEIKGFINLRNIYCIPIALRNEIGKIKLDCYKKLIDKLNVYHKSNSLEDVLDKAVIK